MKTVYREKRYYCGEYLDVYLPDLSARTEQRQAEQADLRRSSETQSAA